MKKFLDTWHWFEEAFCNLGFLAMTILVFSSAIARGIGFPLAWSIDIAQLLLCWTTLIGADVAYRHGKFLGLDILTRRMPEKVQKALDIIMEILVAITLVIFIIYGYRLSVDSWARQFQTLTISYSFITLALPVMSTIMFPSVISNIIKKIKHFNKPWPTGSQAE